MATEPRNPKKWLVAKIASLLAPLVVQAPRVYKYVAPLALTVAALLGPFAVLGLLLVGGALLIRILRDPAYDQKFVVRDGGKVVKRLTASELAENGQSSHSTAQERVRKVFGPDSDA